MPFWLERGGCGDPPRSSGAARGISRRRRLQGGAAALAAPALVRASALGAADRPAPSNRLGLGLIGLGSMGMRHVKGFIQEDDCQLTAVCDVDAKRRQEAYDLINKQYGTTDCAAVHDFRDLLARRDLDTVCIAIPDHWHAIAAIGAIHAGKDVYGEKPLALTIDEGQRIVREVNRHGCLWQTGSWQRSTRHFRFACELVRNGRVGPLQEVRIGIGAGHTIDPQPEMAVPDGFDYEMWLGPAPWEPYTEKRCHWNFRWIFDYSGGQVTDWGAHHIDIAQWGMGTDDTGPVEVAGTGAFPRDGLYDTAVHYRFECRYASGVTLRVASNNFLPQGVRFVGDRGWVHVTRAGLKTQPADLVRDTIRPDEIHLARPRGDHRQGHRRDFLDCVKTRAQPVTPAEIGHRSATICHLGNIAMHLGRTIHWNPQTEGFRDDAEATRLMGRAMRTPGTV